MCFHVCLLVEGKEKRIGKLCDRNHEPILEMSSTGVNWGMLDKGKLYYWVMLLAKE